MSEREIDYSDLFEYKDGKIQLGTLSDLQIMAKMYIKLKEAENARKENVKTAQQKTVQENSKSDT